MPPSAFDHELLGIHLAIRHFDYYVQGKRFTVFTDHIPIVKALSMASEPKSHRQARQLAAIAEATPDVQHVADERTWCPMHCQGLPFLLEDRL